MRFDGKVVVITGTAGGQGRAAALAFAAEGAIVVGSDVDLEGNLATASLVEQAGGRMTAAQGDATDEAAVEEWIAGIVAEHTAIDVLYANAGVTRFSPIAETSYDEWKFVLQHELDIVFLPVRAAWPHLRDGSASVLLVGSTAGISGSLTNTRAAHSATKGGVIALSRQLAAEAAPRGIRVNCISPGVIRTPATEGDLLAADHPMRTIARHIPLGRLGTPDDIAGCALFLASDAAAYVTGANLVVDGGWSAVLPGAEPVS